MQVFKAYFKVMRGSAVSLAISLSIFMGLTVIFSFNAPKTAMGDFESARTPVAIINRDGDAELARGLVDYPVSYTHLDVYKRQSFGKSLPYLFVSINFKARLLVTIVTSRTDFRHCRYDA